MKSIFIIIIVVLTTLSLIAQEETEMEKLNSFVKEVKEKFAPDKRTAIFNIDLSEFRDNQTIQGETNITEAKTEFEKLLNEAAIDYKDLIEVLPQKSLGDKIYGVINLSVANLRSKPDHPAELSTQALLGTPIKVFKKESGFYLVQTPDNYISWLDDDGFEFMNEEQLNEWKNSDKIIYLNEYGWCFNDASINSARVSDLAAGNLLKLIGEDGEFYKAEFPDKRIAYVLKSESQKYNDWYSKINPTGENILTNAYRFMGVPYLWGGTSSKGMDCSGFTKTVFFLNGIVLPRDASQQVHTGEIVDTEKGWENLLPGDLLFFGSKADGDRKERITHVAIYIGDGDFIHAAGRVRINSFNENKDSFSPYRKRGFIRAKRILNSIGSNGIEMIEENSFYKK